MEQPTVFLSSTIYDFRDLRGAIKDYLQQRGVRVLASEFNDFTKPLDKHSYQACLETIEQADLFVLLIGSRVGGWIDEPNKISITRSEYRRAYELAQKGRLRLLSFVRTDVWNHRESVKQLRKHLRDRSELSLESKSQIAAYPTGFMTDAEAIISFIDEVGRNKETAEAVKGNGKAPIANWLHPFSTFAEVREAIDPLILRGLGVRMAAGRKALQAQLLVLLQGLLQKTSNSQPVYSPGLILDLAKTVGLTAQPLPRVVRLASKTWSRVVMLSTLSAGARADHLPLLPSLSSELLLSYDPATSRFTSTPEYDALTTLVELARQFGKNGSTTLELLKHGQAIDANGTREVPVHLLAACLHQMFRWMDLVGIARALVRSMEGYPLVVPERMPRSPFLDQEQELASEETSLNEARAFCGLPVLVERSGGQVRPHPPA